MRRLILFAGFALASSACSEQVDTSAVPVTETDSAGVRIFQLARLPPWNDSSFTWDLELEHSLRTAAPTPGEAPMVYQPQSYTRMPNGTLVILDGAERRLVVIDPTTEEVRARFAPSGQGPGEIWSSNASLWPAGDHSVWVLDPGNMRLSRFSLDGKLEYEKRVEMTGMGGVMVQRVGSGEPWAWRVFLRDRDSGVLTDSVGRFSHELGGLDFVAPLPDRPATSESNTSGQVLFDAMGWFAPVLGGVVVGRNDRGRFRFYAETGETLALIDVPMAQRPIDAAEEAGILEEFLGVAGGSSLRATPEIAEVYPLYNTMRQVNDTLFALQQGFRSTPDGEPRIPDGQVVWRVFSVHGRYGGTIVFPPGVVLPYWVEDGRIIATHRDELGVATIQTFRLTPPD